MTGAPASPLAAPEAQDLLARITALAGQATDGDRVLVAIAGPPGSGKSTLAAALADALPGAALVPMDGFHLDNRLLDARGLRARKGSPDSFDADGFAALMARLRAPGEVIYPVFDRDRDLAIAGAGVVTARTRIVLVEGNYLLLDRAPWDGLRWDLSVSLSVPMAELERRLTARWRGLGRDRAAIAAHLANDLANARLVLDASRAADVTLVA